MPLTKPELALRKPDDLEQQLITAFVDAVLADHQTMHSETIFPDGSRMLVQRRGRDDEKDFSITIATDAWLKRNRGYGR